MLVKGQERLRSCRCGVSCDELGLKIWFKVIGQLFVGFSIHLEGWRLNVIWREGELQKKQATEGLE